MTTDRWPVEFVYISRRLTRQILDQDAATRRSGRHNKSIKINVPPVTAEFAPRSVDHENQFILVKQATVAVLDNTGTLDAPGAYVRFTVDLHACGFNILLGFDSHQGTTVAGFFASQTVADVGRVFIALFGSVHNFLGSHETPSGRWFPSDAVGLYQLLSQVVEPGDAPVSAQCDVDDAQWSNQVACEVAARTAARLQLPPARQLEVLARIFIVESNMNLLVPGGAPHEYASTDHDRVVIGAPVWVATPAPTECA